MVEGAVVLRVGKGFFVRVYTLVFEERRVLVEGGVIERVGVGFFICVRAFVLN